MSILVPGQIRKANLIGLSLGVIASILIVLIGNAHSQTITCDERGCSDWHNAEPSHEISARRHFDANGGNTIIIGSRPAGCPEAYCGCGLRKFLGLDDRRLNLADNWKRIFPRTHARAGTVAVRNYKRRGYGHVMLLIAHVRGNVWRVRDYNSGRGLSRIHNRSIAGYSFVSPDGGRVAMK